MYPCFYLLQKLLSLLPCPRLLKLTNFIDEKLRWGFIIRGVSISFLSMFLSASLNLKDIKIDSIQGLINYVIGALAFLFLLMFMFICFSIIFAKSNKFKTDEKLKK